ncbi:MAG: hypothetical protein HZB38_17905 [Planctomycetes bacterium]|nr:hypothetical protein [Planctomycetota bacterium]
MKPIAKIPTGREPARADWVRLILFSLVPVLTLLALRRLHVPLGKPGTITYPYSPFDALRLMRVIWLAPAFVFLAVGLVLSTVDGRLKRTLADTATFFGLLAVGVWALAAPPHWSSQFFINMLSPSHDGAFLTEADHVRVTGVRPYLRDFAARAATPPQQLRGTRVISNPPGMTLLACGIDAVLRSSPELTRSLSEIGADAPDLSDEMRFLLARGLAFACALIAMWAIGGLLLIAALRLLLPPTLASAVGICGAISPMVLLFSPGKDAAQLLTTALPLLLWLLAVRRRRRALACLAGAALVLACWFSLVHPWLAAIVMLASFLAAPAAERKWLTLRAILPAAAGALLAAFLGWLLTDYEFFSASAAVAKAQAAITRGPQAMPLAWQYLGVPLFLLFCGPALGWLLTCGATISDGNQQTRRFGGWLFVLAAIVMLGTTGFTNMETPRLWIPFAALLTVGAACWRSPPPAIVETPARRPLLVALIAVQLLASAVQWSQMDMREAEMRLLNTDSAPARFFH